MTTLQHINFEVPRYWVKTNHGSKSYPDKIKDWFSEDFDNYFIFHHPVIIDLDYLDSKLTLDQTPDTGDAYSRPQNHKLITFQEFLKTYSPTQTHYSTFGEFIKDNKFYGDNRPAFLFGVEEGSGTTISDLQVILELLDPSMTEELFVHYDWLRHRRGQFDLIQENYVCKIIELSQLATSFNGLAPEFILQKENKWCLTTLYDDCFSAIACNNDVAERLKNKTDTDIYPVSADTALWGNQSSR